MAANVKVLKYISHNGNGKAVGRAKGHIKYMEANREIHRNKPQLFNGEREHINRRDFFDRLEGQPKSGVVLHKMVITLSEDERDRLKINLKQLARDTMASFETKINRRLDWVAAIHDDKGHPHVHIAIRGRDMDGKQVGIFPIHVKQLKEIADREKTRQAEHTRGIDRSLIKEYQREREPHSQRLRDKETPSRTATNDILSTLQRLIRKSEQEIERARLQHENENERERRGISR